jgi:hypothetical protein
MALYGTQSFQCGRDRGKIVRDVLILIDRNAPHPLFLRLPVDGCRGIARFLIAARQTIETERNIC